MKIIVEGGQILSTVWWVNHPSMKEMYEKEIYKPFKATTHPMILWAREKRDNYMYTCDLCLELCKEFERRYGHLHKTKKVLLWLKNNVPYSFDRNSFEDTKKIVTRQPLFNSNYETTPVPLCMPEDCFGQNLIESNRNYYIHKKMERPEQFKHRKTPPPEWLCLY